MEQQQWLSCLVSPGQFPDEYAVAGTQHDGKIFSLFADQDTVVPPPTKEGRGFIKVTVIDRKGELALIRLPAQTFENGQHVTVKAGEISARPIPERIGA